MFEFIEKHKIAVILVMLFMQCVSVALDTHSLYDRRQIRADAAGNRRMLDARARIQIALINTGKRRGAFTDEEIKILRDNWDQAEYSEVGENPFK